MNTERHWAHDDPYPAGKPLSEPRHIRDGVTLYGLDRLMYRPWQSTWWQRLLARLAGVRL